MNINWTFVLGGTVAGVVFLVAVAEFLQGGSMWPLLLLAMGILVLAGLVALGVR